MVLAIVSGFGSLILSIGRERGCRQAGVPFAAWTASAGPPVLPSAGRSTLTGDEISLQPFADARQDIPAAETTLQSLLTNDLANDARDLARFMRSAAQTH
jgi:hypothetical protein